MNGSCWLTPSFLSIFCRIKDKFFTIFWKVFLISGKRNLCMLIWVQLHCEIMIVLVIIDSHLVKTFIYSQSSLSKFEPPSDAATNETFIELMCEFEPSAVYRHLRNADNYRLQETLEVLLGAFGDNCIHWPPCLYIISSGIVSVYHIFLYRH